MCKKNFYISITAGSEQMGVCCDPAGEVRYLVALGVNLRWRRWVVGVRGPREMAAGPNLPRSWSTAWSSLRARSRFSSGEEGELLGLAVGEVTEGDADQAEGAAVPEFGEEGFGAGIELLRDVAGLGEAALVGVVLKSLPRMVTVRQRQRRPSARRRAATLSHSGRAGPDWPAGWW